MFRQSSSMAAGTHTPVCSVQAGAPKVGALTPVGSVQAIAPKVGAYEPVDSFQDKTPVVALIITSPVANTTNSDLCLSDDKIN